MESVDRPKQIVKWWGPNGFTTTIEAMDVRPGGDWKLTIHSPDGKDFPNRSVFLDVVEPERIVYSHEGGRKGDPEAQFETRWTFVEEGGKTRLTGRMVFASVEQRDVVAKFYGAIEGGNQTLARLAEHLRESLVSRDRAER